MNLFDFSYEQEQISNRDGSKSRFGIVYGEKGNVIHTKKDTYHIISTEDVSELGVRFVEQGYKVTTFTDKSGESIGLNIALGTVPTVVGDKSYNAIITVPNNGGGKGFLTIKELRLVCLNGMMRTLSKHNSVIKIPHSIDYQWSLTTMQKSLQSFVLMLDSIEAADELLDKNKLSNLDVMFHLNKWFFEYEFPKSQMPNGYTFEDFRRDLYEYPKSIKAIDRHEQLMSALNRELEYNKELNLDISMYTVYATVANYLSRRIEKSKSEAPEEVQFQRVATKLDYFILNH